MRAPSCWRGGPSVARWGRDADISASSELAGAYSLVGNRRAVRYLPGEVVASNDRAATSRTPASGWSARSESSVCSITHTSCPYSTRHPAPRGLSCRLPRGAWKMSSTEQAVQTVTRSPLSSCVRRAPPSGTRTTRDLSVGTFPRENILALASSGGERRWVVADLGLVRRAASSPSRSSY